MGWPQHAESVQRPHRHQYDIAWMCALTLENVAARRMLDKVHKPHGQSPADTNKYFVGSIGQLNVVIAQPPLPGNCLAAVTITNLKRTFPNIKYVLLVGIGGGIPFRNGNVPVRLGDVAVATASGNMPGVIHYHRETPSGDARWTDRLITPPHALLTAANDIEAQEASAPASNTVGDLVDKRLGDLPQYECPGSNKDRLFRRDYQHRSRKRTCDECECDTSKLINRPRPTGELEKRVVVHRGTIASVEDVLRDVKIRDQMEEKGIICVETEAAGVSSGSSCLVIRGISDYCDSHKNDLWQCYAAATAAAYARLLLLQLPHEDVSSTAYNLASAQAAQAADSRFGLGPSNADGERGAEVAQWLQANPSESNQIRLPASEQGGPSEPRGGDTHLTRHCATPSHTPKGRNSPRSVSDTPPRVPAASSTHGRPQSRPGQRHDGSQHQPGSLNLLQELEEGNRRRFRPSHRPATSIRTTHRLRDVGDTRRQRLRVNDPNPGGGRTRPAAVEAVALASCSTAPTTKSRMRNVMTPATT